MGIDITGIGTAVTGLNDILGKFIPDATAKAQAQAQIEQAVLQSRNDLFTAAKDVAVADAGSQSWLARNSRPIVELWCMLLITWVSIIAPIAGSAVTKATIDALTAVPGGLWAMLAVSIGAYPLLQMASGFAGGKK